MSRMAEKIGCRPPWDTLSSSSIPICSSVKEAEEFGNRFFKLLMSELKIITNITGCLTPCIYKEYEMVGEPFKYQNLLCNERYQVVMKA